MLSVVVLTKNEEDRLARCLESVKAIATEIVVIDDFSSDKTLEVAARFGTLSFQRRLDDFASQKNFGLAQTTQPWVLFMDADEYLSSELAQEIMQILPQVNQVAGYRLNLETIFLGKPLHWGEFRGQKILRLVKKERSPIWQRKVHEVLSVQGQIVSLRGRLEHDSFRSLSHFVAKINQYTDLEAQLAAEKGEGVGFVALVLWPGGKFLVNYFGRLGLLDGTRGLMAAVLMSYHSFLKRAKIWASYLCQNYRSLS